MVPSHGVYDVAGCATDGNRCPCSSARACSRYTASSPLTDSCEKIVRERTTAAVALSRAVIATVSAGPSQRRRGVDKPPAWRSARVGPLVDTTGPLTVIPVAERAKRSSPSRQAHQYVHQVS